VVFHPIQSIGRHIVVVEDVGFWCLFAEGDPLLAVVIQEFVGVAGADVVVVAAGNDADEGDFLRF